MEAQQVDDDFIRRTESTIGLLEHITEEIYAEDTAKFKLNPSLMEGVRRIYAARFALRDCIDQHKARAAATKSGEEEEVLHQ